MELSAFDYPLPPELIAQQPLEVRDGSRMLVVDRQAGKWRDAAFRDFPDYLSADDCLVLNDTRVFPCRLLGRLPDTGREVELFLLRPQSADQRDWTALARPGRRLRPGVSVHIADGLTAEILEQRERGERLIRFHAGGPLDRLLEAAGHMPLPPYIHRPDTAADRARYQTVFARNTGSAAAPTAGLHFTPEVLARCEARGARLARITLHVGLGTFQPLESETVEANRLHSEWYEIPEEAAAALRPARRVVAVGTTSVRTLETAARRGGLTPQSAETDIFLYPGCEFQAVGAMLTNFHLPKSSLLLLVCAFGGTELMLDAYHHAVRERYRFFSYGDCMLIL